MHQKKRAQNLVKKSKSKHMYTLHVLQCHSKLISNDIMVCIHIK